jgi:glycosyltransferase involved in cell wall biosynthesis
MAQEKMVLVSPSVFLAENSRMRLWLEEHSANSIQLWYPGTPSKITNGISPTSYDGSSHFVSVGRFNEPRKGWDRLFLAYKKAYLEDTSIPPLLVIGWGEFSSRDRDVLVEAQRVCPIWVSNNLTSEDRDAKLKTASFFLQASHEEGLGLAALEALSFGIPLICSATDGSREYVIEGVSGMLVEQSSKFIENFSQAIILSQTWNYDDLHRSSLKLFYEAFDMEISKHRLVQIISSQIDK